MDATSAALNPFADLRRLAREALLANVHMLAGRHGVSAGAHQFRSLWTRDFCHAARGLLRIGRADVVRDHLELLLEKRRADGLLPRTLDSIDAKLRVSWRSVARWIPGVSGDLPLKDHLVPEYQDQYGSVAIDGNALTVWTAACYGAEAPAWFERHRPALRQVLDYYRRARWLRGGLLHQPAFSDWQDSVRRKGVAFYTNLIYWAALRALDPDAARGFGARLEAAFRPRGGGLYPSLLGRRFVSLEGNLLAIDLGFLPEDGSRDLYPELLRSPFWRRTGVPGFDTYPDYPVSWSNPGMLVAGLGHYHDRVRWSWLTALAAKVAARMGDLEEARRILSALQEWVRRDGTVMEVYESAPPHRPWRSWLYSSEGPFSWGAGVTLDALGELASRSSG